MAVIFGLPTWVWIAIAAIGAASCIVIGKALAAAFNSLREVTESLELSKRMLTMALRTARDESERTQQALARLGGRRQNADEPGGSWQDW